MNRRYTELTEWVGEAALDGPGVTEAALRRAVRDYAARPEAAVPSALPAELREYIAKVARHAHTITDEEVAALRRSGIAEDVLYELTVSAALGAGLARLEKGLAALEGAR